tara:strand:- start:34595 stop:34780 length:186 start_codon:yes stop_codon:yes gene_type:complete
MSKRERFKFECIIEIDADEDIQVSHLSEEIEAYLNNHVQSAEIVSWRTKNQTDYSLIPERY